MPSKDSAMIKDKTKKILSSALQGKLLLRLGADKYLPQIVFFFTMATVFIALSIGIESTLHQREENKKKIENLRSIHTELSCKLTSLDSVCKVEDMLSQMGSSLDIPQKQAVRIDR